jgi:hypothetical protein
LRSLPEGSNSRIGARLESAQLFAPHLSKTHRLPLVSMVMAFVEPIIRPAGSLAQTSPARYGLGEEFVGSVLDWARIRVPSMPVAATAARSKKKVIRGLVMTTPGRECITVRPGQPEGNTRSKSMGIASNRLRAARALSGPAGTNSTGFGADLGINEAILEPWRDFMRRRGDNAHLLAPLAHRINVGVCRGGGTEGYRGTFLLGVIYAALGLSALQAIHVGSGIWLRRK